MDTKPPLYPRPYGTAVNPEQGTLLSVELKDALEQSVRTFREQWGFMAGWAENKGYIENYRQELERIAILAYKQGMHNAKQ
jgi:hypothetical protein